MKNRSRRAVPQISRGFHRWVTCGAFPSRVGTDHRQPLRSLLSSRFSATRKSNSSTDPSASSLTRTTSCSLISMKMGCSSRFGKRQGLPAPGPDLGGWYDDADDFNEKDNFHAFIAGHSFGQYVSGLARAYAVTGSKADTAKGSSSRACFCRDRRTNGEVLRRLSAAGLHLRQNVLWPN